MSADVAQLPELVRIRCPDCGTETTVSSEESREKLHTHDEKRHDGERTAGLKVRTDDGFRVLPHPDDVATDGGQSSSGTERNVDYEEMAVIGPFRGWATETVDDRHFIEGSGDGYELGLYVPSPRPIIEIRSLQPGGER
ncbi:hypothetical protein [Natronorubrum sp. FCH18a]|uniref:hypothetical protein n=1 Tax=Natronorubrum sp. FCH18a TaxID=3447018 RepID=UPI003F5136C2